jgi:MerR family copper efflux transcriptional regulator
MVEGLTIGRVAKGLGIRPSAVRFYERQGLVASERLANGYRVFSGEAVDVLRFINRAKELGFSICEIREILALRRGGIEPCGCVTKMIEHNLAEIDRRITELSSLRRELRRLGISPAAGERAQTICPIIESDR